MSLDYTTIDFETANTRRGSPCSVGLVKVRDGRVVDERYWLMRPPSMTGGFAAFNTSIHGITEHDVIGEPTWTDRYPVVMEFIGGDVVVAHNAGFDIGVIREACIFDGLAYPTLDFLCTMVLARRILALPSYRLPFVAETLGVPFGDHHDALADARCMAGLVNAMADRAGVTSIHELATAHQVFVGHMEAGAYRSSVSRSGTTALVQPDTNPDADPDGPLFGKVVVFTRALTSMRRQDAWEMTAHVGGIPEKSTTKRTNVLVVGDLNPAMLRPGEHLSGKARRAFELQDAGQQIEVMTEMDFIRALQGGREDPWQLIAGDAGPPGSVAPVLGPRRRPFTNLAQIPGENYWDWFDRILRHPNGRAQGWRAVRPLRHSHTGRRVVEAPRPARMQLSVQREPQASTQANDGKAPRLIPSALGGGELDPPTHPRTHATTADERMKHRPCCQVTTARHGLLLVPIERRRCTPGVCSDESGEHLGFLLLLVRVLPAGEHGSHDSRVQVGKQPSAERLGPSAHDLVVEDHVGELVQDDVFLVPAGWWRPGGTPSRPRRWLPTARRVSRCRPAGGRGGWDAPAPGRVRCRTHRW